MAAKRDGARRNAPSKGFPKGNRSMKGASSRSTSPTAKKLANFSRTDRSYLAKGGGRG